MVEDGGLRTDGKLEGIDESTVRTPRNDATSHE